ncbi:zinc finger protein Ci-ZF-144 [Rhodotorula diobovata]|uniref:Zinc finger protein Ci-ZF-144 n=1 Tax=Rhodotorula diobovata TaxID=5288 RepID=A0A5C5FUF7_9BASI|nr:zinc finger protein Ci-ZF-144 [Rhodotorula diobovata]
MARGLAKEQAQQKSREKAAKAAGGKSQLKTRAAAFKITCPTCRTPLSDYKNFKEHFEAKHPKLPLPTEESLKPAA